MVCARRRRRRRTHQNTDPVAVRNEGNDSPKRWSALDLEPAEQPRWLADSRLPRAATCLLLGDEGMGKSLLWVLLVAHITTGTPFPEFGIPPRSPGWAVLVLTRSLPGVIAHCMLLMAQAGRVVRHWLGVDVELLSPDACFSWPMTVPEWSRGGCCGTGRGQDH